MQKDLPKIPIPELACIFLANSAYPVLYAEWHQDFEDYLAGKYAKKWLYIVNPVVETVYGRELHMVVFSKLHFHPMGTIPIKTSLIVSIIRIQKQEGSKFLEAFQRVKAGEQSVAIKTL